MKKLFKILRNTIIVLILLVVILAIAIQTKPVQNWLVDTATNKLSKELGTKVSVKSVDLSLFNKAIVNGVFVEDKKKDTFLYVGALKVNITNWFFLKDKTELSYLAIEDAVIKMNRKDSIWNYQYILDHFKSTDTTTKKPTKPSNKDFQLKDIQVKNLTLIKDDGWRGEIITVRLNELKVDIDSLRAKTNSFYVSNIHLKKPFIDIQKYKGTRPDNYFIPVDTSVSTLKLFVNNVNLKEATLTINHSYLPLAKSFDGEHIWLTPLNVNIDNLKIIGDTLTGALNINAKERSGLEIKQLIANIKWTPRIMALSNLDLVTNKSHIKNYYAMKYKNFDDDFAFYETNVTMDAHFKDTYINSDDVAFFAPSLSKWKKELEITGDFLGTVADFKTKNLIAKEKNNGTTIYGNLAMKGLPDIETTLISFTDGKIKTNYTDLSAIIPTLKNTKTPNLAALKTIEFNGNFIGTISNFSTFGKVNTALGTIDADLQMQLPNKGEPTYKGDIAINQFDFKTFFNEDKFGILDFKGKFDGKSFSLEKLDTKLEGFFNKFTYNGYTYNNITTNGKFQNKYFNGEIKVNDSNFHMNGNLEANFSKPQPSFNMLADITKTNLKALNLTKNPLNFTGLLDLNFSGDNIDNFLGSAKLINAKIGNDKSVLRFDSLYISSSIVNNEKKLRFASNDFGVDVKGDFKILDLPTCFQSFLHNYYPSYISSPASLPQNQNFSVNITTRYVEPLLQLFDKNIKGFNDANLQGSVNTINNSFGLTLALPYARYNNLIVTGADITGIGNIDSLNLKGTVADFQVSDSFSFPNTNFQIASSKDVSKVTLQTRASNTLNEANLDAIVETSPNGVKINFNPSSFILNDKKWSLDNQGEISLFKNFTEAKNLKFTQGLQELSFETAQSEGGNSNSLDVKLKDVIVGDVVSVITKKNNVEGIANGVIHVDDIFGNMVASSNLKVTDLSIENDSIGEAQIDATYSNKTKLIKSKIFANNKFYNFNAIANFNLSDTATTPMNAEFDLQNSKIDIVQKLIGNDVFSSLNGYATGKIQLLNKGSGINILGKAKIKNTSLIVNFTKVKYLIDSADISFNDDGIDFGEFQIKDTIGNIGTVKGYLYEKNFNKMNFNFDLATSNMLLLNTKEIDNDLFYGSVIGKANLSFKGPESNCIMDISGEPTQESRITIRNKDSKLSNESNFIVFKPIGEEITDIKKQSNFNLLVNLDVVANNKIAFDVVIDEESGDMINAKGNGRLKMKVGTNEDFDMRGRLSVAEGKYNFNWQSIIKKPFTLRPGENNYIEWNGNPYDANMHIEAAYEAKNISTRDLIGSNNSSFSAASKNFRDDVFVVSTLTGKLMRPDIKFRFDFPINSPIKNDDVFDRFRKRIEADDNEMIKQVSYLIVFNTFAPYGDQSIAQTNFTSIGVNTISSMVTKVVNNAITDLLFKITKDKSLAFDLSSAVYSSNDLFSTGSVNATSTQFDRYNLKVKVSKKFLDDRISVNVGSDFDINLRTSTQTGNFQWLPDVNVQWSLNDNRNFLLVVFNKNSLDISGNSLGRRTRQGVGITYKKDFDISPFEKAAP